MDTRIAIIRKVFEDVDNVIVMSYSGLTVDFFASKWVLISLFVVYVLLLISSTNVLLVRQTKAMDSSVETVFPFNFSRTYFLSVRPSCAIYS